MLQQHGRKRGKQVIAGSQVAFGAYLVFDSEGRKPKPRVLAESIENVRSPDRAAPGFGHEERVAFAVEAPAPLSKIGCIEVGRIKVQRGAGGLPHIHNPRLRTAAGKVARRRVLTCQPGIHIHGNVIGRFAPRGNSLDETGIVPSHKDFVGLGGVSEDLSPGAHGLVAIPVPQGAQVWIERVVVSLEVACQFFRHCGGKGVIGSGRVVARVAQNAHLVLHLHH